jgi:hypothetical protein
MLRLSPSAQTRPIEEANFMEYGTPIRPAAALAYDSADLASEAPLEVNVIFTDPRTTAAALQEATRLATDLKACIRVRQVIAVPFSLPLDHPQISVPFAEEGLSKLASKFQGDSVDIAAHLYLSRNQVETLAKVLPPKSVAVIAGRKRAWPTMESRIAKRLEAEGHRVVFLRMRRVELRTRHDCNSPARSR